MLAKAVLGLVAAGVGLTSGRSAAADNSRAVALANLASPSVDERRAAAGALSSPLSPGFDALTAIGQELAGLRRTEDGRMSEQMAQLPLRGASDTDTIEVLVRQAPDPVVETALATVCMMHALAGAGTTPAVRLLIRVSSDAAGAFRPLLFAELKDLDDRATAALVEARGDASPAIRTWAKDVLDALGKRTPGDTVQTTDDRVLVDVLAAFASIRDQDALPVVLSFVNSDRVEVRTAAREATLAYGAEALGKVRTTYAALTGRRLREGVDAQTATRALFDAYDRQRLSDVYARLDEGLAKERDGNLSGALADFADVLARQPELDRAPETAPALVAYAEQIDRADPIRAVDALQTALRLNQAPPLASRARSDLRFIDGQELATLGITDTVPFEDAVALDPTNTRALTRLRELRADATEKRKREGYVAASIAWVGLCLVAMGLVGLRRWRTRTYATG